MTNGNRLATSYVRLECRNGFEARNCLLKDLLSSVKITEVMLEPPVTQACVGDF